MRYLFCGSFVLYLCLVFVMLSRLFIAALWSPAGKGLTYWLLFVMSNCDLVTFPCGILGQVWYLIVLIPDLCRLSYFATKYRLSISKVRKRAKNRNRYNQAPQLTQDTNGKVTTSQLDITNESQEVSPFPAGDHKASKQNKTEIT